MKEEWELEEIENVTNLPVIRPLAIFDKVDIIKISRDIGTYDISIRPYEDCCTIFDPKNPTTQPRKETIDKIEESFNYMELVEECCNNLEVIKVDEEYSTSEENFDNYL